MSLSEKTRRGSAVLFVLALVFAFSSIALVLIQYSASELKPRAASQVERDLRADAYSALNAAIAVLKEYSEIDGNLYSSSQGWLEPFADGRFKLGSDVYALITDESGKIPISTLSLSNFKTLFELFGMTTTDADECAACLWDWMDSDSATTLNGADVDDYNSGEPFPPNREIKSFEELKYIKNLSEYMFDEEGHPTDMYRAFTSVISLEDFSSVNLNSVSEDVLRVLCELENKDYDDTVLSAIRGEIGSIEDGVVWIKSGADITNRGGGAEIPTKNITYTPQLLKIEIVVTRGIAEYYLCAYYGNTSSNAKSTSSIGAASSSARTSSTSVSRASSSKKATNSASSSTEKSKAKSTSNKNNSSNSSSVNSLKITKIRERGGF